MNDTGIQDTYMIRESILEILRNDDDVRNLVVERFIELNKDHFAEEAVSRDAEELKTSQSIIGG